MIAAATEGTPAGSPYIVNPCLQVAAGATLSIDPGVVVKFVPGTSAVCADGINNDQASLIVDGALVAIGTATQPITFTSNNDTGAADGGDTTAAGATAPGSPGSGDWGTILFAPDAAIGQSTLSNVQVLYGQAVVDNNASPTLDAETVSSTTLGLQFYAPAGGTITNERVTRSTVTATAANFAGIVFNQPVQGITLTNNVLDTPGYYGGIDLLQGGSNVTIDGNVVQAGALGGIQVSGPSLSAATIINNSFAVSPEFVRSQGTGNVYNAGICLGCQGAAIDAADTTISNNNVNGEGATVGDSSNGVLAYVASQFTNVTIDGNTLADLGDSGSNGIYLYGVQAANSSLANTVVSNNTISGVSGSFSGIYVRALNSGLTLSGNNVAAGSANPATVYSGVYVDSVAVNGIGYSGSGTTISNNTINVSQGNWSGIVVAGRSGGTGISGNTVDLNASDTGNSGIYLADVAAGASLSGNTVQNGSPNGTQDGIVFAADADGSVVAANTISNVAGQTSGIVFLGNAHSDTVYANHLFGNQLGGILLNPLNAGSLAADNTLIDYNVVAGGSAGVLLVDLPAAPTLDHNTLANNTGAGLNIPSASTTAAGGILLDRASPTVSNSIIYGNSAGIYDAPSAGDSPSLLNNDVFNNDGNDYVGLSDPTGSLGNINDDPLFNDPATSDFSLGSGSPAIGAASDGSDMGALQTTGLAPFIVSATATPGLLTPGDTTNNAAAIAYVLSAPGNVAVSLRDGSGNLIRTLQAPAAQAAGGGTITWDGTDGFGSIVPEGNYIVAVQALDDGGNVLSEIDVAVSVATPSFTLTAPAATEAATGTVFTVTPSSLLSSTLTSVSLCLSRSTPGNCDLTLGSFSPNGDGTWSATASIPEMLQPGSYDLFLSYAYGGAVQHGVHDLGIYNVSVPPAITLNAAQPYPNPLLAGSNNPNSYHSANWSYQTNQPMTVSLIISDSLGNPVTTVSQYQSFAGCCPSIGWDGTANGQPVADGVYDLSIGGSDASGNPASVSYNGAPATQSISETVISHAMTLTNPLSGTAVSGTNIPVAVSVSPLLGNIGAYYFYLAPVNNPNNLYYAGPASLQGGQVAGTINTLNALNGRNYLDVYFYVPDLNGGYDYYTYQTGVITVNNPLAFYSTPYARPSVITPNGDGNNDTLQVSFTANSDVTATLNITDPFGTAVTATSTVALAGQQVTLTWNGTDAFGNPVPDRPNYHAGVTIVDAQGRSVTYANINDIGVAAVPFSLTSPLSGTVIGGVTSFAMEASPGFSNAILNSIYDYGNGGYKPAPTLMVQPAGASGPATAAGSFTRNGSTYTLSVDPPTSLGNGNYDLYVDLYYSGAQQHEHLKLGSFAISHLPAYDNLAASQSPVFAPTALAYCYYYYGCLGSGTNLSYVANTPLTTTLAVQDAGGATVTTIFTGTQLSAGAHSSFWNGQRDDGSSPANGVYTATLSGTDPAGTAATTAISLGVVAQPATLQPSSGSSISGTVPFTATLDPLIAGRVTLYDYYIAPRPSSGQPYCFTTFVGYPTSLGNGTWTGTVDTRALNLSNDTTYVLMGYGSLASGTGSQSACFVLGSYQVGNAPFISGASVYPNPFTPGDNDLGGINDTTMASYSLNRSEFITATVQDRTGTIVRTIVSNLAQAAGAQSVTWDGRDDAGVLLPDGTYAILLDGTAGGLSAPEVQVPVTLVTQPILSGGVAAGAVVTSTTTITAAVNPLIAPSCSYYYYSLCNGFNSPLVMWAYPAGSTDASKRIQIGGMTNNGGPWSLTWHPSLANGSYDLYVNLYYVPAGSYYASGELYKLATVTVAQVPALGTASASPPVITLDAPADSANDVATLTFGLNQPLTVTAIIADSSGNTVATLGPTALTPDAGNSGQASLTWNGQDADGASVATGTYTATLSAVDAYGQSAAPVTTQVQVANPSYTVSTPAAGSVLSGTVAIRFAPAAALGAASPYGYLYAAPHGTFNNAISLGYYSGAGANQASWNTTQQANGSYDVYIQFCFTGASNCWDRAVLGTFTLNNTPTVTAASANPNPFTPNGDGTNDTATINFTLNRALAVTATISDGSSVLRHLVADLPFGQGTGSVAWDGLDDSGNPVPDNRTYTAIIQAGDDASGLAAAPVQVQIGLTRRPFTLNGPPPGTILGGRVRLTVLPSSIMAPALNCYSYYYCSVALYAVPHGTVETGSFEGNLSPLNDGSGLWAVTWDSSGLGSGLYDLVVQNSYNGSATPDRTSVGTFTIDQSSHRVALAPAFGRPGDTVAISGTGYLPQSPGTILFDSLQVGTFVTDDTGAFNASFVVPPGSTQGSHTVSAGDDSGSGSANYSVTPYHPALTANPSSGVPQTNVSVIGSNFAPGEKVDLTFDGVLPFNATADSTGAFTQTFSVPASRGLGQKTFNAYGETSGASASAPFTVTAPPATVVVSPTNAGAGDVIQITGTAFLAGEPIHISATGNNGGSASSDLNADNNGSFLTFLRVPPTGGSTVLTVKATGGNSLALGSAQVTLNPYLPILTLSDPILKSGDSLGVYGGGFRPNEPVHITIQDGSAVDTMSDGTGAISTTMLVPVTYRNSLQIVATGQVSGGQASANLGIQPYGSVVLMVQPGTAKVGDPITVTATGFRPLEYVIVDFGSPTWPQQAPQADATGAFTITSSVPPVDAGNYTITATGQRSGLKVSTTIATQASTSPSLAAQPSTPRPGDQVILTATGLLPGELADFALSGQMPFVTVAADISGTATATAVAPPAASLLMLTYTVRGRLSAGKASASVTEQPFTPSLSASPDTVSLGDTVQVSGNGFRPREGVRITMTDARGNSIGELDVNADDLGNIGGNLTVPAELRSGQPPAPGSASIQATGFTSGAIATTGVTINPAAPTQTPVPGITIVATRTPTPIVPTLTPTPTPSKI